ncbi:MAG: S8 family peptidase [Bacteroidetes bacterium]|nr:S8 family peptidase [Bacteroidota bacterium]
MKLLIRLALVLFLLPSILVAQEKIGIDYSKSLSKSSFNKIGLHLQDKIQEFIDQGESMNASGVSMSILVKGNPSQIRDAVEEVGGVFKYSAGDVSAVIVPISAINDLSNFEFISRLEITPSIPTSLNDRMIINNNVLLAHQGAAPLTQSYDGDGVIFGIIDTGIDFNHPDFKNSDGTTRIKYIWDQRVDSCNASTPQPYNYGMEWNSADIDAGICKHDPIKYGSGHGTMVAGVAAGNGSAVNNYKGVAPKTDIIAVGSPEFAVIDCSVNFTDWLMTIADGVDYIFKKADVMGKPCVINISLGTYIGSHDGKDLAAQIIDNLITAKNGRAVVAAAGNAGNSTYHLGYDVTSDTTFTWFKPYGANCNCITDAFSICFNLWADTADFNDVWFSVGADKVVSGYSARGNVAFDNIQNFVDTTDFDTLFNGGNRLGIIKKTAQLIGGVYKLTITIYPDSTAYYWRFSTTGSGRFDIWSWKKITCTSDMEKATLPTSGQFPDIVNYMVPDLNNKNTVSSFQCAPNVITVGNWTNRDHYYDFNMNLVTLSGYNVGEIYFYSSAGPTRDGRLKPEISATGEKTLSTGPILLCTLYQTLVPSFLAPGGMHIRNGGTSSASPVVAGAVALYLQKNPNASIQDIRNTIALSAKVDSWTGATPNNRWGYGKVDAYQMLITTLVYGCTDIMSLNYNPAANVDDGSCIPIVYGCTDSLASNYNPLANVDDGSCWVVSISESDPINNGFLTNYPNPFDVETIIHYSFNEKGFETAALVITDILGKTIATIPLYSNTGDIRFAANKLSAGVYLCNLYVDGQHNASHKIIAY